MRREPTPSANVPLSYANASQGVGGQFVQNLAVVGCAYCPPAPSNTASRRQFQGGLRPVSYVHNLAVTTCAPPNHRYNARDNRIRSSYQEWLRERPYEACQPTRRGKGGKSGRRGLKDKVDTSP